MSQSISALEFDKGKLCLFFCPLEDELLTSAQADSIRRWLPEDELTKVSRYIQLSARDKGLMVRGFLRGILSLVAKETGANGESVSPADWRFEYGKQGKPKLVSGQQAQSGLLFNISHSGDWLVVAVMGKTAHHNINELGVDIERCRQTTNIYPILNHYFTHDESEALLALPNDKQRERFFDLWALKESYIKAKGLGLALSLKSFSFDFSGVKKAKLDLFAKGRCIDVLPLFENIQLNLHRGESVKLADTWSVLFGKLNEEYRFAVSLDLDSRLDIHAHKMDIKDLLNEFESN
ncbi:4'-phosphopantetheinyl transferase family protein [Shewanella benthica]|uniref:4'-phosphopantetheinyl transferase family protein n=1 Tax=Shewanella benthica TaxID=43661 RepID=A0A330M399_9GAMM|nr:4'-phosphopantetheinyl transferase superfamily protein [Shewanella benthica]SQH75873.1 4'-phosphopantetheinyl transferase family protein [Shewanella benthica]